MWIAIAAFLFICWVFGFIVFHVAGFLIHLLLLVAIIALVYHFVRGRRGAP